MERSDWSDDDALEPGAYPPAPLPPHERSWRHPSELSATPTWSHLEPPLTIGRGLLIATGAIGGLLSIAVLWAMLPSTGRGGLASPTAVTSTANDFAALVSSPRADTFVASTLARPSSTALTTVPRAITSEPNRSTQSTFVTTTVDDVYRTENDDLPPIALAVGDTMVITTARAAQGHAFVTVSGADGQSHDVTVLMVDRDLGVAVLSPEAAAMADSYAIAPAAADGDAVTVLTSAPISTNVHVDAKGKLTLDAWDSSIAEGTPVVNADGLLVGMCSHGASGPMLVNVANLASLLPTKPQPAGAWLGIHIVDSAAGPAIDAIDPNGPAGQAGMVAGDVITAVDGVAVSTIDDLKNAIAGHAPGDAVAATVMHADHSTADLSVTLGSAPSI